MNETSPSLRRVSASVARATVDLSQSISRSITLDARLMGSAGLAVGDIIVVETMLGRETLARLAPPLDEDFRTGVIRLDRLLRQSLKAKLNEQVRVRKTSLGPLSRVILRSPVDLSAAHDLNAHIVALLAQAQAPLNLGAAIFSTFPHSRAGTVYRVDRLPDGPGYFTQDTRLEIEPPEDAHGGGVFDITFEDVGGVGPEIKLIRELIQLPLQAPQVYRHLGIRAPKGIVLYGPPGSGKTHLTKAIANEIDASFYYINGPSLIGTLYGETEANLRRIFNEATHHAPSIIFIDEIDAVAPNREHVGTQSDVRSVTQLLSLMDGLTSVEGVVVIGTTNRIDAIDPAMRRPGRFDREVFIDAPSAEGRLEIFRIHTRDMPLSEACAAELPRIADVTHGFVGADIMELCRESGLNALRRSTAALVNHLDAFNLQSESITIEPQDFRRALETIRPSAIRESFIAVPDVSWTDIGGLEDIKRELRQSVLRFLKQPEALEAAGVTAPRGILLHGPSGTGKTMIAKAIASDAEVNFIAVDGPEIFGKWLGESEAAIRHVFRVARQLSPCIVFFDQLDALVPNRGTDSGSRTTERVVSQILSELDGIRSLSNILVIGATNRIDLVDPSVLRPGRLGQRFFIPLPDETGREAILRLHLANARLATGEALDDVLAQLVQSSGGLSGAELGALCDKAKLRAFSEDRPVSRDDLTHALVSLRDAQPG